MIISAAILVPEARAERRVKLATAMSGPVDD
jgi:hypothetical protein